MYSFPRSTKGASKQRRENINLEIGTIRDNLPVQEAIRKRLSQLQVMALCKAFIGKSNVFSKLPQNESSFEDLRGLFDFTQALPGFLLMTTRNGRILYISENVMEFLGHSMVDVMTQSETIFELIDSRDKHLFENIFGPEDQFDENSEVPSEANELTSSLDEKLITFSCRMGMLRHARRNPTFDRYKKMRICGRFVQIAGSDPCDSAFVALCSPRLNQVMVAEPSSIFDTMVYQSVHRFDMKFVSLDHNGQFHLGYSQEEMKSKSWYELIHPEDVLQASKKHKELLQATGTDAMCSLCVRMQTRRGDLIWIQMIMQRSVWPSSSANPDSCEPVITCINHVISESEAINDEKEEEQIMINPLNGYSVDSIGSKSSFPTVVVDTIFVEETPQPDRAEVLRRLKRKMTGAGRKNKSPRYSDDCASTSSGSVPSYTGDDMSPFPSSNNHSVSSGLAYSESSASSPESLYAASSPVARPALQQIPTTLYTSILGSVPESSMSQGMASEENGMLMWSMPTPEQNHDFGSPSGSYEDPFYQDDVAVINTIEEHFDETSSFFVNHPGVISTIKPKKKKVPTATLR